MARCFNLGLFFSLFLILAVNTYFIFFSQGILYGSRVFCIILVPLSGLAALWLTPRLVKPRAFYFFLLVMVVLIGRATVLNISYPGSPESIPDFFGWAKENTRIKTQHVREYFVKDKLLEIFPEKSRVWSDSHYLQAAMSGNAKGIEMISPASPEVEFLYGKNQNNMSKKLKNRGIGYGLLCQSCPTTQFFMQFEFFKTERLRWKVLGSWDAFVLYEVGG